MPQFVIQTIQAHIAYYDLELKQFLHLALKRKENESKYPGIWQAITGTYENNETSIECLKREVEEETGIIIEELWFLPYVTSFYDPKKDFIHNSPVFGILVQSNKIRLSDEHSEYKWVNLEDATMIYNLPSHKEASKVFENYILKCSDEILYRVKI